MLTDTFDVLSDHHLASTEVLARAINDVLMADMPSFAEVADKAMIPDQIRVALVGSQYGDDALWELNQMMLTYTRPLGPCHAVLPPGEHELCSAYVSRKITDANGETTVLNRRPGRFISDDPEAVAVYRLSPQMERVTNAMFRTGAIYTDSVGRMPALAQYAQHYIARVHKVAQAQLPLPSGNGNGNGRGRGGNK